MQVIMFLTPSNLSTVSRQAVSNLSTKISPNIDKIKTTPTPTSNLSCNVSTAYQFQKQDISNLINCNLHQSFHINDSQTCKLQNQLCKFRDLFDARKPLLIFCSFPGAHVGWWDYILRSLDSFSNLFTSYLTTIVLFLIC